MRILFLSSLYSTPLLPQQGVGNARILHAMRAHADVSIMAPLPWYPRMLVRSSPKLLSMAQVPRQEIDDDGSTVLHPRHIHLPYVGRGLYAGFYGISVMRPMADEVRRFQPQVLLSAWAYPDGTAAVALGAFFGLPTVLRVMGSDINDYARQWSRRPQIAWAVRKVTRIIAVSRALGNEVHALGADNSRVDIIPTGVDNVMFRPLDRGQARRELNVDGHVVVVPGRLAPEKGVHCFIDAFALLDSGVRALIVGDGPLAGALRSQVAALGLDERVRFEGFQPEARMKLYYAAADVVCLPSFEEGWPDVLMESLACGCPVVASDVGGVSEIVSLCGSGMLVPAKNTRELAGALDAMLKRTWNREETARIMSKYTLDQTARQYVDTCRKASHGTARTGR